MSSESTRGGESISLRGSKFWKRDLVQNLNGHTRSASVEIDLAKEFAPALAGIGLKDGNSNATVVRQRVARALSEAPRQTVVALRVDGLDYTPSSAWISEAFGKLNLELGCETLDLLEEIAFVGEGVFANGLGQMARYYIENAVAKEASS